MSPALMLIALLGAHAVLDYAGQGDFMSKAKNRAAAFPEVPWWNVMAAHALIHGAAVALITGIWWLCIAEAVIHFAVDDAKCTRRISYNVDQLIHVACKLVWLAVAFTLPA